MPVQTFWQSEVSAGGVSLFHFTLFSAWNTSLTLMVSSKQELFSAPKVTTQTDHHIEGVKFYFL